MSMKKWLKGIGVFLAMFVVMTISDSLNVFAETVDTTQPMETANAIEILLKDDSFNPKEIIIPNRKSTTFLLKNIGKKEHTFTVKDLGIDAEVQPGKEKTITVTPESSGTYELICRYHFQQGMVGKVIVQ